MDQLATVTTIARNIWPRWRFLQSAVRSNSRN